MRLSSPAQNDHQGLAAGKQVVDKGIYQEHLDDHG
jgi:hypothetical protein